MYGDCHQFRSEVQSSLKDVRNCKQCRKTGQAGVKKFNWQQYKVRDGSPYV